MLGNESSQCSGHLGGRQGGRVSSSRTCSLPCWCCFTAGCVCSQLVPNSEFWTVLRLRSSTWQSSYCSDPGLPPSDTVLATLYVPSSSFSLWGSQIGFGFVLLVKSYVVPQTHTPFSGLIYSLLSPGNANTTRVKPDKCQFCNFTDRRY